MPNAYADIAFTPAVRAQQVADGSRQAFARAFEGSGPPEQAALGAHETEFIEACRSLFMATVSETGWPYVQHRGGPPGFVRVVDPHTLAFADYAGNRQLVSVGNLAGSDRVALILVDFTARRRLKLYGHAAVRPLGSRDAPFVDLAYRARPQRVVTIGVAAFDWNCPQHLPQRLEADDVDQAIARRDARIAELEARVAALKAAAA
ncbi:MAG: pyridoxamine 5'-phosphate oxidase family protein [Burkholderiales bacterium]|jgi:hypothetical protein|nr:pyridoxamine 5'-phosphate oxidase family protein [Burkholderiales bacterium]